MMSARMLDALTVMRESEANDHPFVRLDLHHVTRRALLERDWALESPGDDGLRYRITGRGRTALKAYEVRTHRTDGICPRCNERPRAVSRTGRLYKHCYPCHREMANLRYHEGGSQYREDRPCSDCGEKPRYRSPNGTMSTYCADCKNQRTAALKRKYRAERLMQTHDAA